MRIKQLLLSAMVVLTFVAYTLQQRHEGSGTKLSLPPLSKGVQSSQATSSSAGNQSTSSGTTTKPATTYKDGTYVGSVADAFYGNVQVQATVAGGKITDVKFLQYPNDRSNSIYINQQAIPYLQQEAIQAQSANVDVISGATYTSTAFTESLSSALQKAQAA